MEEANVQLPDVPRYLTAVLAAPTARSVGSLACSSSALRQSYLALSALGAAGPGGLGGAASPAMLGGGAGSHLTPMASFRSDLSPVPSAMLTAASGGNGGVAVGITTAGVGRGGEAGGGMRDVHHHQHLHAAAEGGGAVGGATLGAALAADGGKDRKEGGRMGHFNRDRGKYVFNAADRH